MQQRGRPNRQPRRGGRGGTSGNQTRAHNNHNNGRQQRQQHSYTSVPPHASISPGTSVSIVLKEDQPTGHRVAGIVAELLTRGDHPRGVKVRLRDGRVGRVQALVPEEEGAAGEALVGGAGAELGRNGEMISNKGGAGGRRRGGRVERDVRENDEYFFDESRPSHPVDAGIFSALEEADRKYEQSRGWGGTAGEWVEVKSELIKCPICEEFEGDENAVAFHVGNHFGE